MPSSTNINGNPNNSNGSNLTSKLPTSLRDSIATSLTSRRPLLTHLNADTTWLLSIPIPNIQPSEKSADAEKGEKRRGKAYYHILIDPWLCGSQSDVAAFFSQQWHAVESCVQSVNEVESVISYIEDVACGNVQDTGKEKDHNWIDAVIISHEFTDHMHKPTLLEVPSSVPVFATDKAAPIISSWKHFSTINTIPRFEKDWRKTSIAPLPNWVGVGRVAKKGANLLYYHSAIMITFPSNSGQGGEQAEAEAVIYTPHGIDPLDISPIVSASPPIRTLALLHGLQDISISSRWNKGAQLNKGAHNGLKVQRILNAGYWVGTHDEVKKGGGIVSWFLDRKIIGLEEAMGLERELEGEKEGLGDVRFMDVENGGCLLLK